MPPTTHTPGPWRVGDAGHTVFGPQNGNPSPETIASVSKKANARLIAAAPAMREVLQRAITAAKGDGRVHGIILRDMEAALALADGKEGER